MAILRDEIERLSQRSGAERLVWSYRDLATGETASLGGDEAVPVGDQESLVQYLAVTAAGARGELDLDAQYVLDDAARDDGSYGVIGCMSNGLSLSLGDYLAQTVITGDAAAFAVVRHAIAEQGRSARDLVDRYLGERGAGPLDGRPRLAPAGPTGVEIGSTTADEQLRLLDGLADDAYGSASSEAQRERARRSLTVLSSVLKGGGLIRGLPGYGPFKTKIAHSARIGNGNSGAVRSDAAIYFHEGEPRFIVSVCVDGIVDWPGVIPGMALAEDCIRDVSRACWGAAVGRF